MNSVNYIKLGEVATARGGSGFPEIYQGGSTGVPFIKVSDMNLPGNERFINKSNNYLERYLIKRLNVCVFPKDSIVFAKVGAALLHNRRRLLAAETAIDNNMMAVTCNGIDVGFLYHYLTSVDFEIFVQPGAVPSINQKHVHDLDVPKFALKEQQKIAEILTSVDEQIETTEKLIKKKKLIKNGLLSELLVKHSSGNSETIALRELAYGVRGVSYTPNQLLTENTGNSFTLLRSNNIKDNYINFDSIQLVPEEIVSDAQRAIPGDIAVCMSNGSKALVGKSACFSEDIKGQHITVGAFCSLFKPINRVDSSYLKHLFQSSIYQKHIDVVLAGSAINNLQNRVIEDLRIPDINKESRLKIGDILDSADNELLSTIHQYEKLNFQKQGLMQDLLTGRVRVN